MAHPTERGLARLTVTDCGPGMPETEIDVIGPAKRRRWHTPRARSLVRPHGDEQDGGEVSADTRTTGRPFGSGSALSAAKRQPSLEADSHTVYRRLRRTLGSAAATISVSARWNVTRVGRPSSSIATEPSRRWRRPRPRRRAC
ncbi:hypothetical protein C9J85_18905 [Haloferax sp. wsp5]|nr:hypothetical protein C9J85_18905 [Haloferax sp. wsp5]